MSSVTDPEDVAYPLGERRRGGWSVQTWIVVGTLLFTTGAGWNRISKGSEDVADLKKFNTDTLPLKYLAKDIYDRDRADLKESIERLNATLKELIADQRRERTSGLSRGRQFDQ